jgi:dTMP kinase
LFVTFEGIEGSGKTTQLRRAAAALATGGIAHVATREPGGTPVGALLRQAILQFSGNVDSRTELLMLFADRRQHLVEEIEPALDRGDVVLCDRYTDASRAYQGAGRKLGEDAVDDLHRRFIGLDPKRTYLFDCRAEVALERLASRDGEKDRIEREALAFHKRVRAAYRKRAALEPRRFLVLDASRTPDEVFVPLIADLRRLIAGISRAGRK